MDRSHPNTAHGRMQLSPTPSGDTGATKAWISSRELLSNTARLGAYIDLPSIASIGARSARLTPSVTPPLPACGYTHLTVCGGRFGVSPPRRSEHTDTRFALSVTSSLRDAGDGDGLLSGETGSSDRHESVPPARPAGRPVLTEKRQDLDLGEDDWMRRGNDQSKTAGQTRL